MAPTRVILMSCGSYNPPTNMHLRMFEIARDHLHRMGTHIVVGGIISPVHDAYAKTELASAKHRCTMLRLALQNNDWIRLSTWETRQNCWTKTRLSLQHHQNLLNSMLSNSNDIMHHMHTEDTDWVPENVKNSSDNTPIQIKLLCGADLLESFGICGLWLEEDIDAIVGEHGLVVITREGSNPNKFIYDSDILSKYMHNICIVTEWIPNEVSSTRIRRALKRGESVRYLLQDSVIDYIYKNGIYDARATDTTKLELSPNANKYLHIEPHYLSAFLTPSPSDVTMGSPSPVEIISTASIDVPDAVLRKNLQNAVDGAEAREQFINAITPDNGNIKHIIRLPAYPGQAKQVVVSNESGFARIIDEVGDLLDKSTMKFCQPGPSTSGEFVLGKDDRSLMIESVIQNQTNVEQKEILDLRSNVKNTNIDLGASDTCKIIVQIQSDQSSSNKMTSREDCRLKTENIQNKETSELMSKTNLQMTSDLFQISEIESQISHIADADLSSNETIANIQLDHLISNELIPKEDHRSIIESVPKDKTELRQKEILAETEIVGIDLDPTDDREIVTKIQASHLNSNELRLKECCWPTRKDTANDDVEFDGREIISQKKIVDVDSGNNTNELRIIDKICLDQTSFSKIIPENDPKSTESVTKEKVDFSGEINISKEIIDVEPDFINTDNVVKVQPSHTHNLITVKKDDKLKREKTKIELHEGKIKFPLEDLELYKINTKNKELIELGSENIIKYNPEFGNNEIDSKQEILVLESEKSKYLETKTTLSPSSSITSLDGRHECALSDFSVDKEDYRFSQYCSNEEELEEKSLRRMKSMKYADEKGNIINNTIDSANDSEIDFKKGDIQIAVNKNHEQKFEDTTTKKFDDRTIFSDESFQSEFNVKKSLLETETDIKFDDKNRERIEESFRILQRVDEMNEMKKTSKPDTDSSEKWTTGDPNLEIDGKYLKSIVNSRKSPRKIRKDQICDTEIKELKNRQVFQSEDFQTSSSQIDSSEKTKETQSYDINVEIKDQVNNDRKMFSVGKIFQNSLRTSSMKVSPQEIEEFQSNSVRRRSTEEVFQDFSRTDSTKMKSPRRVRELQTENNYGFKNQTKSDQEIFQSRRTSQKSSKKSSTETKSSKNIKQKTTHYRSGEMKDYDRSINDRVISQLEEVFQNSSRKSVGNVESPKTMSEDIKIKDQDRSIDNRETFEEFSHHSSKMSSTKSSKGAQIQKDAKADEKEIVIDKTKQDFKDVYTRKVRRYNIPLQGSLDSMMMFDESNVQQPKKDDVFTKKSKSYESIKRIQEVFLGVPSKMSNGSSQLDIPDDFCSICCYMNEITFRTEEEVSSPNQETFYTLRSACSSLADDDESIECDICNSLNLQESTDNLQDKVLINSAHGDIPCELCRICGEVDDSFEQNSAPTDRCIFNVIEPNQDDDDSFEIENCGFQSGTESADDRSRVSERERIKESFRPKSQSLFIHGSSMVRDQPRELYFIPKDEIAILTSGMKRVGRKGSLFRKKEDLNGSARNNRRYSSVDSLQLTKMSVKTGDKVFKNTKSPMLAGSADNLQILRKSSRRSKSLQRLADNSSADNLGLLVENLGKEENAVQTSANWTQKTSIRDKEAVKMILTQHGIKIISEKETAL